MILQIKKWGFLVSTYADEVIELDPVVDACVENLDNVKVDKSVEDCMFVRFQEF